MSRFGKAAAKKKVDGPPEEVAKLITPIDTVRSVAEIGPGGLLELIADAKGAAEPPRPTRVEVGDHTATNWGARHGNEDRIMFQRDDMPESQLGFWTVGVLDGHDTEVASDMVSQRLPGEVSRRLKEGESVVEAYTKSMEALEDQLKKVTSSAGSCVLSCTIAGRFLWCSNLGDCRSILVPLALPEKAPTLPLKPKVNGIVWMSCDHKASAASEKLRIEQAGGKVNDGRVEGLEPSRTLGDFDVKAQVSKGVISIVPEVRRHEFQNNVSTSQAIMVCATDGVWDVLSGQDVCNLIVARKDICRLQTAMVAESESPDSQVLKDLAEDLVQFSIAKGSRDDCTAIVTLISVPAADADARRNECL